MRRERVDLAEGLLPDNLQEIQDALTRGVGWPVLFVDPVGRPLAACEDLSSFCRQLTRGVAIDRPCLDCGRRLALPEMRSRDCDVMLVRPSLHRCPLGCADIAVPVSCEGEIEALLVTAQTGFEAELEAAGASLAAVAELAGALIAARRRSLRLAERVRRQDRWIQEQTRVDALTGLPNRRRFAEALEAEIARAARYQRDLSVAILDLEDLCRINAESGHQAGDAMLRAVARCLSSHLRSTELAARMGGAEFALLLPEMKRTEAMIALARLEPRLRELNTSGELPAEVRLAADVLDLATSGPEGLRATFSGPRRSRAGAPTAA